MSTGPAGAPSCPLDSPDGVMTTGAISPCRGTKMRSPSDTNAARFNASRSASGSAPPATASASFTRASEPISYTPGDTTAPATYTTAVLDASVGPDAGTVDTTELATVVDVVLAAKGNEPSTG